MLQRMASRLGKLLVGLGMMLAVLGATANAGDDTAELRALLEKQGKEIEALTAKLQALQESKEAQQDWQAKDGAPKASPALTEDAVRKVVGEYLKDNPGAGMPSGVQSGWYPGSGFTTRSAPAPSYVNWQDESRIPFELRIRGRIQADYYYYNPTDHRNHQTGVVTDFDPVQGALRPAATFSQEMIKRARFSMSGNVFDPALRFYLELDGNTRGVANTDQTLAFGVPPGLPNYPVAGNPAGNGVGLVDHSVRLFSAFIAYDWKPCCFWKGCGQDCPEGTVQYSPTVTFIAGKFKPFFSFEEYLGSGNQQFVEYAMSEWFFDAEDDNLMTQAGIQARALDDRLFLHSSVTNGNETQTPNLTMDDYPGVNVGFWYDFGGNWNYDRKAWDLYGDCVSDVDYSVCPVVRVGAMANVVPMDRRDIYGNAEYNRVRASNAAPGGTNFIGLFNAPGAGFASAPGGPAGSTAVSAANSNFFTLDRFDSYTYEAFVAGKYRGLSLLFDGWFRDLSGFQPARTNALTNNAILYATPTTTFNSNFAGGTAQIPGAIPATTALFPNRPIHDLGFNLQGGYFIIPKKLEVAARWAMVYGQSGDIYGDGTVEKVVQIKQPSGGFVNAAVFRNAFRNYHESDEYAIGVNYYFKRQLVKWSADFSVYDGGNPAAGGQSPAGFLPGVDGWMIRTQIQLGF